MKIVISSILLWSFFLVIPTIQIVVNQNPNEDCSMAILTFPMWWIIGLFVFLIYWIITSIQKSYNHSKKP